MGHRDIWGKDSRKWKKWCPCFDAEAEYKSLNYWKLGDKSGEPAKPEIYVLDNKVDYTKPIKDLAPWTKNS